MPPLRIRRKSVEFSALLFTGHNLEEALRFVERSGYRPQADDEGVVLHTTRGTLTARPGTYLILDENGEVLAISKQAFHQIWEVVK